MLMFFISDGESGTLSAPYDYFINWYDTRFEMGADGEKEPCVYALGQSSGCVAKDGAFEVFWKRNMLFSTGRQIEWAGLEVV